MQETQQVQFTYDPIGLSKLFLQMYVEKFIEGKTFKARQFAFYEYLRLQTDEECEELLMEYVEQENLEAITFDEWEKDCEILMSLIESKERFKSLVIDYQKKGYGTTGMGVYDKTLNRFFNCTFGNHWKTLLEIVENHHPLYAESFEELYYHSALNEFKGISRSEMDEFIMSNFELIGGNNSLDYYLNS